MGEDTEARYARLIKPEPFQGPLLARYDRWWRMAEAGGVALGIVVHALVECEISGKRLAKWTAQEKACALVKLNYTHEAITMSDEEFGQWLHSNCSRRRS